MPKVAVLPTKSRQASVLAADAVEKLRGFADVKLNETDACIEGEALGEFLAGCEGALTSWGCAHIDATALEGAQDLKIVTHAAGSVRPVVSDALWERGIKVTSAAAAIAVDVAQTTLGLMIVSVKNIFRIKDWTRAGNWGGYAEECRGTHEMDRKKVGIVAASHVGRNVIRLLAGFDVEILLYDPFVTEDGAKELGARKVELDELCRECDVVSLHAPSIAEMRHMIDARRLAMMKDDAVLINTARGSLIDENALCEELAKGRLFACIDVTDPEPPSPESPLRSLPNVVLTPHIAGCAAEMRRRVGDHAVEELRRFFSGEPLMNQVTREMLASMA